MKEELMRDRIVVGINNTKTNDSLFAEPNLYLQLKNWDLQTVKRCWKAVQTLKNEVEMTVVNMKKQAMRQQNSKDQVPKDSSKWKYCGYKHDKRRCPAFGKHAPSVAKFSTTQQCKANEHQGSKSRNKVNELKYEVTERRDISCDPDVIELGEIPKTNKINEKAALNWSNFDLNIDSGAKCKVIFLETIKTLDTREKMRKDQITWQCYAS